MKKTLFSLLSLSLLSISAFSNGKAKTLQRKIENIAKERNATVGINVTDSKGKTLASINGNRRFPLQSVFKFHIGLAMLSEIDKGKFTLDQKITITKDELLPGLYSPLRDENPNGGEFTIAQLLQGAISASDNVACDVLLKLLGGAPNVEKYLVLNGFKNLSIKLNEEVQQSKWELQFDNWITPNTSNKILMSYFDNRNNLLSTESHKFLWDTMRGTETGANRLKGLLPSGTVVAHKTGTSGKNDATGIRAAVNDIGVVFLPNGEHFFISVYVTDSKEDMDTNEKIIADISKAAWDFFI
ncbi:MAG: class A beta-lactamase, subclass A2 [Pyrinomonadaceae bacterium]